jgi:hypothetical protein
MPFPAHELERLHSCLQRLSPHCAPDEVAVAGGVALELGLPDSVLVNRREKIADVDLVAQRLASVRPSVARHFPIIHYHVPQAGFAKLLVMVVDPPTRLRVDIFADTSGAIARARPLDCGSAQLRILDLDSVLDHKLTLLAAASQGRFVDGKHHADALCLGQLLGREVPQIAPAHLGKTVYSQDLHARCARCEASADSAFPLAPKADIFALLGYV